MGDKDRVWTCNHIGMRIHGAIILGMFPKAVQKLKGFDHFLDKKTTVLGTSPWKTKSIFRLWKKTQDTPPKWRTSHIPCFQRTCGDCTECGSLAVKEIHSIHMLKWWLLIAVTIILHLLLREILGYQIPVGSEGKNAILLFCDMQIFLLNKWKDLILRTLILLGKKCWPRGQERLCVLCLFFLFAHLHQGRRIQKSPSSKRATHGLLPHIFPHIMGSVKIEPYLCTCLYRALRMAMEITREVRRILF